MYNVPKGKTAQRILPITQMGSCTHLIQRRGIKDEYFERFNYEIYGGTPVLGINSTVMIGHGISNDFAVKNMILLTKDVVEAKLPEKIKNVFQ